MASAPGWPGPPGSWVLALITVGPWENDWRLLTSMPLLPGDSTAATVTAAALLLASATTYSTRRRSAVAVTRGQQAGGPGTGPDSRPRRGAAGLPTALGDRVTYIRRAVHLLA